MLIDVKSLKHEESHDGKKQTSKNDANTDAIEFVFRIKFSCVKPKCKCTNSKRVGDHQICQIDPTPTKKQEPNATNK